MRNSTGMMMMMLFNNAIIENCNLDVLYDAKATLYQAGLPGRFWSYVSPCVGHLHNLEEGDMGDTPWYKLHNEHFKGQAIPFGCGARFLPAATRYDNDKAVPERSYGLFLV